MSVLIDSYGWIEYFSNGPLASRYAKYIESANSNEYITPSIILYEVYKRIKILKGEELALKIIAHIIEHTAIIHVDKNVSLNAAEISMRANLSMADSIIKAVAEEKGAKIVTSDKHFKDLSDVIFIS